jgi:hypothetical protein
VRVGTSQLVVPDVQAPGPLALDLHLEAGAVKATNHYQAEITIRT